MKKRKRKTFAVKTKFGERKTGGKYLGDSKEDNAGRCKTTPYISTEKIRRERK